MRRSKAPDNTVLDACMLWLMFGDEEPRVPSGEDPVKLDPHPAPVPPES